jgi:GT2 family glycosyltransferase
MDLCFCILSHGKPLLTLRCVENLHKLGCDSIIVLDNGSSSEDISLLQNGIAGMAELHMSSTNLGITVGRNKLGELARSAAADRLVFLDNDQFPNDFAISAYRKKADGVVLGAEAWVMNDDFKPVKPVKNTGDVFSYVGCGGMCIDMEVWTKLGGFDPQFSPYYFEDPDFCFRCLDNNIELEVLPPHAVFHEAHSTLSMKKDRMVAFLSNYRKLKRKWDGRGDILQRGVAKWE